MEYASYGNRIKSFLILIHFKNHQLNTKQVARFVVTQGDMVKTTVTKTKFSQLNDKRFHFANGMLSLPYGHPSYAAIDNFKKEQGQNIEKYFWEKKDELLALEKKALQSTPRLALFNQTLNHVPKTVNLNEKSDFETLYNSKLKKNIKYIVFSGEWMK